MILNLSIAFQLEHLLKIYKMKEFKDYTTMVVEEQKKRDALNKKREVVKQRYEERKRLRDEASYEERLLSYARRDENEDIIKNVREHYTAEQIANKEYLQNTIPYRLQNITKEIDEGNYEGMSVDMDTIQLAITDMENLLEGFGNRLDMLEGKPPYPYSKVLMHK